jgi:SAM-dependent methyltransferase
MKEYAGLDADLYDWWTSPAEGDVEFYVGEAKKTGSPVLELGCGTGRITIPAAEAGLEVVGLDNAPEMLAKAREKVSKLGDEVQSRVELVEGDMRDFSLGRRFNLIMIPFRAFLHLLTEEDQRKALTRIRDHLTDEGRLVFNIFDPSLEIIMDHEGALGSSLKMESEFIHPETGRRLVVWDTRRYDKTNQFVEQYFIFEELDEDGRVASKTYVPLKLRYFHRFEMQYLLELCGLEIVALYGDFQRGPFEHGGEQIWVARRS